MRGRLTLEVAVWIKGRHQGASVFEVMREFKLTKEKATEAMLRIRANGKRYKSKWTGHPGPLGKGELPPRLFVSDIDYGKSKHGYGRPCQTFRATPLPDSKLPPMEFHSGIAMGQAGYTRSSVWRAIATGSPYAGYMWERVKQGDSDD